MSVNTAKRVTDPILKRITFAAVVLISLVGFTILALNIGHAADALVIADPGAFVRWGLPITTGIAQLSMATSIGALVLASYALSEKSGQLSTALNIAASAAAFWVFSMSLQIVLTYLSVTGSAFSVASKFGEQLIMFVSQIDLGRYLLLNLIGGVLVATLAVSMRRLSGTIFTTALAVLSLVPLALTGHAAGTANHGVAVNALGLHLLAVSIWVGGLVTLLLLKTRQLVSVELVKRFSTLAIVSFVLIATSGVLSGWLRVGSFSALWGNYGLILAFKTALLMVLGGIGALYRRRILVRWNEGANFWRWASVEVVLMSGAIGLAAALSRTAPPVNSASLVGTSPAEILTGQKLPPELTFETFFTQW